MTGARVARIKKYIGEDEDFFLTYGDGVGDINIKELYRFHKKRGAILTITVVNPIHPFGLLDINEKGIITNFREKPTMKDKINAGFMVCNKKIFDYLSEEANCVFEDVPMKKLVKEGGLAAYHHKGFWRGMDTQKHVDELNEINFI